MPTIPFDVVAFDLDGTLADTMPDIAASLNHALAALGRDTFEVGKVKYLVGHGARALIRRALAATGGAPDELVERGFAIFLDYYAANVCNGTTAYPGLEDALYSLTSEGVALAICTNKPHRTTSALIQAIGWSGRFQGIVAGDTLPVRKPDPAPLLEAIALAGGGRAAFVGDSIVDAETARAAGIPFIAVSFGFSDRPPRELGADILIDSYDELIPALRKL